MMKPVLTLDELSSKDIRLAGGKAASLGEMTGAGFPVPPGFVVTAPVFNSFLEAGNLRPKIDAIIASIDGGPTIMAVTEASKNICALFSEATVPAPVVETTLKAFESLGSELVAVRSSATVEDGRTAAWAGQLDSYLNTDKDHLIENIKQCWASLFSPRALMYRLQPGRAAETISVAVIVEQMVPAHVSGVAFSIHPLSTKDRILIETTRGLGKDLVAGRVSPDRYGIEKTTGRIVERTETGNEPLLSDDEIRALAALVERIEDHYRFPVDIEWAKLNEAFYILQCRPVTTGQSEGGKPTPKRVVWSNFNLAEVLPGINPPLVVSFLVGLLQPAVQKIKLFKFPPDTPLLRDIKGRLYFNLTAFEEGFFRALNAKDISVTKLLGGEQIDQRALSSVPWLTRLKAAVFGLHTLAGSIFYARRFDRYIVEIKHHIDKMGRAVDVTEDLDDLLALEEEITSRITTYAIEGFKLIAFPFSFYFLFSTTARKWLGGVGGQSVHALLSGGGEKVEEIRAFSDLWRIRDLIKSDIALAAEFDEAPIEKAGAVLAQSAVVCAAFECFMADHGHRQAKELDFSLPRWREDPRFILKMLRNYLAAPDDADPVRKSARVGQRQQELRDEIIRQLPRLKSVIFKRLLHLALTGQRQREVMKSEVVKALAPLRTVLLKIGAVLHKQGLLDSANDIFMFNVDELKALKTAGNRNKERLRPIYQRAADYRTYHLFNLPAVITDLENIDFETTPTAAPTAGILTGIAASHGKTSGIARIISSLEDIDRLRPGDILVTDHTDPGWTPIFPTINGVVTNTGGLISHTSIVAREYGLPAVVNVAGATRAIADGEHIFLDGDLGTIKIIGPAVKESS